MISPWSTLIRLQKSSVHTGPITIIFTQSASSSSFKETKGRKVTVITKSTHSLVWLYSFEVSNGHGLCILSIYQILCLWSAAHVSCHNASSSLLERCNGFSPKEPRGTFISCYTFCGVSSSMLKLKLKLLWALFPASRHQVRRSHYLGLYAYPTPATMRLRTGRRATPGKFKQSTEREFRTADAGKFRCQHYAQSASTDHAHVNVSLCSTYWPT